MEILLSIFVWQAFGFCLLTVLGIRLPKDIEALSAAFLMSLIWPIGAYIWLTTPKENSSND